MYPTGGYRCRGCSRTWPAVDDGFKRWVHGAEAVDRCAECRPAPERKPAAGWEGGDRFKTLVVGPFAIQARNIAGDCSWEIALGDGWIRGEIGPPGGVAAAQLAAEDALRAIAAEILRAVGS